MLLKLLRTCILRQQEAVVDARLHSAVWAHVFVLSMFMLIGFKHFIADCFHLSVVTSKFSGWLLLCTACIGYTLR